jgi:hypothetical protein
VDYQHWEFYVASQDSRVPGDWSGTGPHFELNYGVISNVQLHLIAPLAYDASSAGPAHYGYGDTELGVKFRFLQETDWLPQVGIFPLLEIPSGSAKDNLGTGHLQAFVPLWLQKSWGSWTAYGGGGYGMNSFGGHGNWGFVGGVLDFPNVGTAFNVGTVIDFSEQHHLLFSAGRSIDGPTEFQCYIAYQFTFDNSLFQK